MSSEKIKTYTIYGVQGHHYKAEVKANSKEQAIKLAKDKIDNVNTFKYISKTNGSHLAANVVDFLKERDQKKKGEK